MDLNELLELLLEMKTTHGGGIRVLANHEDITSIDHIDELPLGYVNIEIQ